MKVRLTHRASEHLFAAYDYLQAVNVSAAGSQIKHIFDGIDLLERYPLAGRNGRIAGTRELVVRRTPFIVVYKVTQDEVTVLAVLHGARRWPKAL
jgi:toxin ParE1/3/4